MLLMKKQLSGHEQLFKKTDQISMHIANDIPRPRE